MRIKFAELLFWGYKVLIFGLRLFSSNCNAKASDMKHLIWARFPWQVFLSCPQWTTFSWKWWVSEKFTTYFSKFFDVFTSRNAHSLSSFPCWSYTDANWDVSDVGVYSRTMEIFNNEYISSWYVEFTQSWQHYCFVVYAHFNVCMCVSVEIVLKK